jgi:hypothetical protein
VENWKLESLIIGILQVKFTKIPFRAILNFINMVINRTPGIKAGEKRFTCIFNPLLHDLKFPVSLQQGDITKLPKITILR